MQRIHPKLLFGVIIVVVLVAVPLGLKLFAPQDAPIEQVKKPTLEKGVLAIVGGEKITETDLQQAIEKAYGNQAADALKRADVRKAFLQTLIQEKLIEQQVKKAKISASQQDLAAYFASLFGASGTGFTLAQPTLSPQQEEALKKQLLREKLEKQVVTWRLIDMVSSYKNFDDKTGTQQAKDSLEKIRALVLQGKTMKQAYDEAKVTAGFDPGVRLAENVLVIQPDWNTRDIAPILALHKGVLSKIIDLGGGTFILVQVVDENNTKYKTFEEWEKDQASQIQQ